MQQEKVKVEVEIEIKKKVYPHLQVENKTDFLKKSGMYTENRGFTEKSVFS